MKELKNCQNTKCPEEIHRFGLIEQCEFIKCSSIANLNIDTSFLVVVLEIRNINLENSNLY